MRNTCDMHIEQLELIFGYSTYMKLRHENRKLYSLKLVAGHSRIYESLTTFDNSPHAVHSGLTLIALF